MCSCILCVNFIIYVDQTHFMYTFYCIIFLSTRQVGHEFDHYRRLSLLKYRFYIMFVNERIHNRLKMIATGFRHMPVKHLDERNETSIIRFIRIPLKTIGYADNVISAFCNKLNCPAGYIGNLVALFLPHVTQSVEGFVT